MKFDFSLVRSAKCCCFLLSFLFSNAVVAQDYHHWAQQFGARATFLGGAVVGGLTENSDIYYNPGAFVFVEESNMSINTDVYKYSEARLKNGAGQGIDALSRRLSLYPQMVSGLLTRDNTKKYRIGFAILTRNQENLDISQVQSMFHDVVESNPGDEYYVGSVNIQNNMSETWGGICTSIKLSEKWGIGLTNFLSYRNQRYSYSLSALVTWNDTTGQDKVASIGYADAVRVNTIRNHIKMGVHYRTDNWRFGLSMTAPSISIWGESRAQRELSSFGLNPQTDAIRTDQQKRIPTVYKQPFSIAVGVFNYQPSLNWGISAEYFGAQSTYRMVKAEEREVTFPTNLSEGPIDFLGFYNFSNAVANVAVGGELKLNDKWWVHLSARTDLSASRRMPPELRAGVLERPILITPHTNLYHFTSGLSLRRSFSQISFGAAYSFGNEDGFRQLVDFSSPTYPNQLLGNIDNNSTLEMKSLAILVGYTYFFALLR